MKGMKSIARIADLLVLAVVVLLNPTMPFYPSHEPPRIGDKVEIYYQPAVDTTALHKAIADVEQEMEEMNYYLKVHNVTDEGYNLVAQYHTSLIAEQHQLQAQLRAASAPLNAQRSSLNARRSRLIPAKERPMIAVKMTGGYWRAGHFHIGALQGKGIVRDQAGRIVCGVWDHDTIVTATRKDSLGTYRGQMDRYYQACGQGVMDEKDGCHKEGFWQYDRIHGFGFDSSPLHQLRIGEWKEGRFLGEKMKYTAERIYGIDISRHQHEKGRKHFGINWRQLRITSLGKRHNAEGRTFPVWGGYIKATEGTTIRNRYFAQDYQQARKHGIHVGAYHFFSMHTTAAAQADYFLKHSIIKKGDFPPVLDVEPSEKQIEQMGGDEPLMQRIRTFMQIVEKRTGMKPILYVSQMFINKHMANAADIKKQYNVWIARYGQYKPDVRLVYWQLCPDGKVDGITGDVDINVFNGYQGQFDEFVRTGFHQ